MDRQDVSNATGAAPVSTREVSVLESAPAFVLEIQDDAEARRIPIVGEGPYVLGTARGSDIVLADETVSGRHCEVSAYGGALHLRDRGSKNGTFVGGARITEASCGPGAIIVVGHTSIHVSALDVVEEQSANFGPPLSELAGESRVMRRLADRVRRLASMSAPVLVVGETGTGKELVARALHSEGTRQGSAFVALNVANLPRELVESELFGHERGAFTGAVSQRLGAFAEAAEGTLFLDEIGELPLDAQPKLLRALDGYDVRRVGASRGGTRPVARVVAATHVPLGDRVRQGAFRRDLFHRLEVFVVTVPPLRERRSDVLPIARRLLARAEPDLGRRTLSSRAAAALIAHDWPGNVRELRNALYRAAELAGDARTLQSVHIEGALRSLAPTPQLQLTPKVARALLASHGHNLSAAARASGYPRTSFRKVLQSG
ncbi:MAG: sigma 54-interacting transcriptional regulator [Polyangiaceae bacterium]